MRRLDSRATYDWRSILLTEFNSDNGDFFNIGEYILTKICNL